MTPRPEEPWLQRLLLGAGVVQVGVGLLHFAMPHYYRQSAGLGSLNTAEGDYVVLVTYAVGVLLIAFGAMTLTFALRPHQHLDVLVPYLLIQTVLWTARLALEIRFPLRLDMFGIQPFSAVVMPGVALEVAIFAAAVVRARRARTDHY